MFSFSPRDSDKGRVDFIKYTFIVLVMIFVVILYVWQNIEAMKLKMFQRKSVMYKKELIKQRDRFFYEIERYKRPALIDDYAEKNGLRKAVKDEVVRIDIE